MAESLSSTPQNILDLQGADFFAYVGRHCGADIVKYFELLGVRSVYSLMKIDDIFSPLQEDYLELADIKKKLTFSRPDGTCIIKVGVQHDINILFENLQANNKNMTTDLTIENDIILPSEVIQKYPFLKRLINFFVTSFNNIHSTDEPFLHHFLENLFSNLPLVKSRYRYNELIINFALCLYILSGRNAYDFLRLNMHGALPNITTIQTKLANEGFHALEGEFRYDDMIKYLNKIDSKFAFCAEDCTSAVRKVSYDVQSNSFVGFTIPLDENGMPRTKYFKTNSFDELKSWFQEEDISHLINLHMIQPLCNNNQKISPFALAAYGTNGKYTCFDVLRHWYAIFEESLNRGVRILGYSTDADAKYLLAMKLVSGFFGILSNSPTTKHSALFKVNIPTSWTWFFLSGEQLFLCMQDATHACTKLRNRLLSSSSLVIIGDSVASMDYLVQLIEVKSKFKHNLVKSDIYPSDKQNYISCEKLCAALEYLKEINGSYGTVVYLTIIRCIIVAFIDTSTTTSNRIYYAWLAVFICRIWRTWLDLVPKQELYDRMLQTNNLSEAVKNKLKQKTTKNIFFITSPAFLSVELNAHNFTYLALLVAENQLPAETLKVFRFNSQTCENFFRITRAIAGTFSVSVNFSVKQYLERQEKISVLNSIKTDANSPLTNIKFKFPTHHKVRHNVEQLTTVPETIDKQQIQQQVNRAFADAFDLLIPLGITNVLKKFNITTMKQVSQHIHNYFKRSTTRADFLIPTPVDEIEIYSESDSDSEDATSQDNLQKPIDLYDCDSDNEDENFINMLEDATKIRLKTTKGLCDKINPDLKDSYFLVNTDGKKKYLHKNTAVWYLMDEKHKLSSDRLNRVMQK